VGADLENGYGDSPETVVETIPAARGRGGVGGSIEDATGCRTSRSMTGACGREIRAAAEAVPTLPFAFTLTARRGELSAQPPDLRDTIGASRGLSRGGADVLYAPASASKDDIAAMVRSVDRPVNVVMGLQGVRLSLTSCPR